MNPQGPQQPPEEPIGLDQVGEDDAGQVGNLPHLESEQLDLSNAEISRLGSWIEQVYRSALGDHNRRMARWAEYTARWSGTPDNVPLGTEAESNLPVPYIRWNVLSKLAKEMDALFGEDAQIVAEPVGPSDYRKDKKIGRYMTWRVFNSMKLTKRVCVFVLRKVIYGKSFAYSPYVRQTYEVKGKEVVDYEGPGFEPLWPDDVVLPAEEHESVHEFSWVVRRFRATPEQLLQGEEDGRYTGIKENFQEILNFARTGRVRDGEADVVKLESDEAQAVSLTNPQSAGDSLLVIEWYGKWRMLNDQAQDGDNYDLDKRELHESELVVRYLIDLKKVIGVQDLAELYPELKDRRPFVEGSTISDGGYWTPGLAKMLIDLEDDLRQNHNLGTSAGEHTVGPLIFYRPASTLSAETFEYKPKMMVPVDNPATDVRVENLHSNIEFTAAREQTLLSYGERLTGLSDPSQGRQSDRPNAPRTARGQMMLLQEGNVRIALDTLLLREDWAVILNRFWQLEYMFSPPQMFFRVTEEDAGGLFPVRNGGSTIEKKDRDGRYDFRLKFATSMLSREADKDTTMQRYQLDLQNPLIVQNPSALWKVTNDVHEALGDPNFASVVPQPPEPDQPVNPKEEFNRLLQGEEIHVNAMDNDELHMMRHLEDLKALDADEEKQPQTHAKLTVHYLQHIDQLQHKKIVQALTERALQTLQQALPPQVMAMLTQAAQLGGAPQPPPPGGAPQGQQGGMQQ